jgi:hypothetical protein
MSGTRPDGDFPFSVMEWQMSSMVRMKEALLRLSELGAVSSSFRRKLLATERGIRVTTLSFLVCLLGSSVATELAWSREWKPSPSALARDYAVIVDQSHDRDTRIVIWVASPMLSDNQAQQILEDYVMIAVVRAHYSPAGVMSIDTSDAVQVQDADAKPLQGLSGDKIPPVVKGSVTAAASMLRAL